MTHYIAHHEVDDSWRVTFGGDTITYCRNEDDAGKLINYLRDRDKESAGKYDFAYALSKVVAGAIVSSSGGAKQLGAIASEALEKQGLCAVSILKQESGGRVKFK